MTVNEYITDTYDEQVFVLIDKIESMQCNQQSVNSKQQSLKYTDYSHA